MDSSGSPNQSTTPTRSMPPPPPPRRRAAQLGGGNACLQQIGMGLIMGTIVGSSFGMIIGVVTGGARGLRGGELFKVAGKQSLYLGGMFGGIMSIGSSLRCEELERRFRYTIEIDRKQSK
eukprot:gene15868-18856_t